MIGIPGRLGVLASPSEGTSVRTSSSAATATRTMSGASGACGAGGCGIVGGAGGGEMTGVATIVLEAASAVGRTAGAAIGVAGFAAAGAAGSAAAGGSSENSRCPTTRRDSPELVGWQGVIPRRCACSTNTPGDARAKKSGSRAGSGVADWSMGRPVMLGKLWCAG